MLKASAFTLFPSPLSFTTRRRDQESLKAEALEQFAIFDSRFGKPGSL